ncbi:hypothetical protein HPB50_014445 [Hyalomma asiaticum]|uniref:Uncharacterized protein n=1 Tax=Hyalomma asiaticum TaxID=266040 RepID=A0ACB7SNJ5_HYAAI|nr:hypothetical protein HPB50_014445 [Hyalomma asiaticum]
MDEADIEEVTSMTTHSPDPTAKVTAPLQQQEQRIGDVLAARQQGPADGSTAAPKVETAALPDTDASRSILEPEGMDTLSGPNLPAGKRTHVRILTQATQQEGSGGDEPPPKAPGIRRPTFKPRPNITVDSRQAGKPPPPNKRATVLSSADEHSSSAEDRRQESYGDSLVYGNCLAHVRRLTFHRWPAKIYKIALVLLRRMRSVKLGKRPVKVMVVNGQMGKLGYCWITTSNTLLV